ncbi:MAG: carbohydrate-binding domain-containing protein [Patescibacteria group bacterium]|nr:carbohydrate-binding domain-containing protein [Patescibacteria group bacterium]
MSLVFKIERWKIGILVVVTVSLAVLLLQRLDLSNPDHHEQVNASEGILLNIILPTSYFHAGTQITMFDGNTVDIEDVEVGDKLLTYNVGKGKNEIREVCSKKNLTVDGFYELNEGLLKVTGDDHAYIRKKGGLVGWGSINRAQDSNIMEQSSLYALEVGDYLFSEDDSWVRVDSIEYVEEKSEFYGLDVKTNDDFYANHTLVHNATCECSGCPGGSCPGSGDCPTPSCDRSCSTHCHFGTATCPCGSGGCSPSCSCTPVCQVSGTSTTNPAHAGYTGTEYCYVERQWCQDPDSGCSGVTCPVEYGSNCYNPETNTAPPLPTTLYLCIGGTSGNDDGACTAVSGSGISAANPKMIALPPHAKRAYMKVSSVTAPAGSNSRGVRYAIRVDNQVNGWSGNCLSMYTYDKCQGGGWWEDSIILDNVNVGQVNNIGLQHGAQYNVWGHSATLDRCDDGVACMVNGVSCSSDSASCHCSRTDGYFKINTPPQVVSVSPSSGWSGTVDDEISQGTCNDNNPQIFTVTYSDVDGAEDISNVALWIDNEPVSVSLLHDSMRGMLRKGSRIRIYAEGTPFDGEYATMQLLIDNKVVRTFTDVGYYRYFDHVHSSFVTASQIRVKIANDRYEPPPGDDRNLRVDKIVLDGVTYQTEDTTTTNDCCPLTYGRPEWLCCPDGYFQYSGSFKPSDGWKMFGLGYDASHGGVCGALTGSDCWKNYDWDVPLAGISIPGTENSICSPLESDDTADVSSCSTTNTPVSWRVAAARTSGNNLEVDWEVWFRGDISSVLDSVLDIYAYVYDGMGGADGWDDLGNRELDFVSPTGDAEITHNNTYCGVLANNEMCMYVEAHEKDSRDSGLAGVVDWQYEINGNPVSPQPTNPVVIAGLEDWTSHVVIGGISGGDSISGRLFNIYDMVGNVAEAEAAVQEPGLPWMKTLDGDMYAALGFSNNIQMDFPHGSGNWAMGSYWVGGVSSGGSWEFGDIPTPPGLSYEASYKGWRDSSYDDDNCNLSWYDRLLTLAMGSKCREDFNSGGNCNYESGISSGSSVLDLDRGIYEYSGSTTVSGGTCTHAKVIFVNGTLTIGSTFINQDDDSACLFIARDGITVVGGRPMGGNLNTPDVIEAAFITDGKFTVNDDNISGIIDRLHIKGFVFSDSTSFERDLVWNDNTLYPAEYIEYDPRYIYLLRDMLGNRKFEQCECGICTDYAPCNNW